jgi:hypothetical protein
MDLCKEVADLLPEVAGGIFRAQLAVHAKNLNVARISPRNLG